MKLELLFLLCVSFFLCKADDDADCCRRCDLSRVTTTPTPKLPEWKRYNVKEVEFLNSKHHGIKPFLTNNTIIYYNATLQCFHRKDFCAMIYYMETEKIFMDRVWQFVDLHCTKTGILHHTVSVVMSGGDGPWESYYDPFVQIFNDCQIKGTVKTNFKLLPFVHVNDTVGFHNYYFNVSTYHLQHYNFKAREMYDMFRSRLGLPADKVISDWVLNGLDVMNDDPKYAYLFHNAIVDEHVKTDERTYSTGFTQRESRRCTYHSIIKTFFCYKTRFCTEDKC